MRCLAFALKASPAGILRFLADIRFSVGYNAIKRPKQEENYWRPKTGDLGTNFPEYL